MAEKGERIRLRVQGTAADVTLGPGPAATNGMKLAGRFAIEGTLSESSIGSISRARDLANGDCLVTVHLLPDEVRKHASAAGGFREEPRHAAFLTHTSIPRMVSFEETDEGWLFILETLSGPSLATLLAQQPRFAYHEFIGVVRDLVGALSCAHARGVFHGALTPDVAILHTDGPARFVKIVGFGVSKRVGELLAGEARSAASREMIFSAPELLSGGRPDARSDEYSLAVIIYQALSGAPPFSGLGLSHQIANEAPKPISGCGLRTNSVLLKALSKRPDDRYTSCADFLADLEAAAVAEGANVSRTGFPGCLFAPLSLFSVTPTSVAAPQARPTQPPSAAPAPTVSQPVPQAASTSPTADLPGAITAGGWARAIAFLLDFGIGLAVFQLDGGLLLALAYWGCRDCADSRLSLGRFVTRTHVVTTSGAACSAERALVRNSLVLSWFIVGLLPSPDRGLLFLALIVLCTVDWQPITTSSGTSRLDWLTRTRVTKRS